MSEPMRAIAMGVHVADVLARPIEEIPEGQGGQLVEEIRITPAGLGGRHGGHARQARRPGAERGRHRHGRAGRRAQEPARGLRRGHLAARAPRRRPDVRQRAADPRQRRPPRLPRGGRQRHLRLRRRALGRDRRRHPPPPRRSRVHGRGGGGEDPRARARARHRHVGGHPRPRRAGRPDRGLDRPRAASTSTTCCPTTTRCSASRARTTWRPAAARCSSAAWAAWRPRAGPRAR